MRFFKLSFKLLIFLLQAFLLFGACALATADFVGHDHGQLGRRGRQEDGAVQGGIDFSACEEDPETGLCCVEKEETVTTLKKDPILECTNKNTEQCTTPMPTSLSLL